MPRSDHRRGFGQKLTAFIVISLSVALAAALLLELKLFDRMESRLWDLRVRAAAAPEAADESIKLIVIDQRSLDYFAEVEGYSWPWPRALYGYVIRFLERGGARAVAFDMLFTEDSFWGVDDDRAFAESVKTSLPVVMAAALLDERREVAPRRLELLTEKQQPLAGSRLAAELLGDSRLPRYASALLPVPELLENVDALGNVRAKMDGDGVFRHTTPAAYVGETPVLSLPFAVFDVVHGGRSERQVQRFLDEEGHLTVRFFGPEQTYPHFSAASIIKSQQALEEGTGAPSVSPEVFKDSYVLVSVGAPGLFDSHPTPLSSALLGVEFNANVLDNLLHQSFIKKVPFRWALLQTMLFVAAAAAVALFVRQLRIQFLLFALLACLVLYFGYVTCRHGYWFPLFVPAVAMTAAILLAMSFQYYFEGRAHRFIRGAFGQYVSNEVIAEIVKDPTKLSLGGDRRELTIFFSDIAGFTAMSESLEPSQLVRLLNEYLTAMTDIILESGGTLDKYSGDAIICFWNAPLEVPDHPRRAVETALRCQETLRIMRPEFVRDFGVELSARIGVHTGGVVVGNFGSSKRFDYTVIGDAANVASRLEGANKAFGTSLLISDATRARLGPDFETRKVGAVQVLGRKDPVTVWEVLDPTRAADPELKLFEQARLEYESRRLEQALEILRRIGSDDSLAAAYLERIERELADGSHLEDSWSHVWKLTAK